MSPGVENESQRIAALVRKVFERRKLLVTACLLGVLLPVLYYNETAEPLYRASSSLVFEEFGNPVSDELYARFSSERYLFNRLEEINSRAFARDVAEALPEDARRRFPVPRQPPPNFDRLQHVSEAIHRSMTASPVRNSNLVRIRVQMSDPELCLLVANLALEVLQRREDRIRLRGITDLRKFIENQLERFNSQLHDAEANLMAFKEQSRITSIDSEAEEVLRKGTEAEVLYNTTRANREAAEEKLLAVQSTLAEKRNQLVPAVTNIATPSAQKLKDRLVELQSQYAQLIVQNYPADHPQLVRLQEEIQETKRALTDEAMKVARGSSVGDPLAQIEHYGNESVALQIEIESLKARENALKQTVDGYGHLLGRLPAKEFQLARLVRERDVNQKIYAMLLEKREEVRISEAKNLPNIRVIDRAQLPRKPIMPRKDLNALAGAVLGLIVGLGMGLVVESRSSKMESILGFERETGWSVLALVPRLPRATTWKKRLWDRPSDRRTDADIRNALVLQIDPESAAGEAYLMLRTRLELQGIGSKYGSLLVTSGSPGDGKSNTVSNLAAAFAAAGRNTLVVDAELRRPVMHTIFGVRKTPGLSNLLLARDANARLRGRMAGGGSVVPAAVESDVWVGPSDGIALQASPIERVTVLASGERVSTVRWERHRGEMRTLFDELQKRYEVVLVDSASAILVHDVLALCGMVDAVLVVVDAGSYDVQRLMETRRLLESAGANVIGAVLNKVDPGGPYGYYYSQHYEHRDIPRSS
jgi:tyrosine-protein kinase Etk/Wzc